MIKSESNETFVNVNCKSISLKGEENKRETGKTTIDFTFQI